MSCFCDYDMEGFCKKYTRKARKEHKCFECKEPIEIGDTYSEYCFGGGDGGFSRHRVCDCCEEDWNKAIEAGHCQVIGDLQVVLVELYGGIR